MAQSRFQQGFLFSVNKTGVHDNWPQLTDYEETNREPNDADWLRRAIIKIF